MNYYNLASEATALIESYSLIPDPIAANNSYTKTKLAFIEVLI